MTDEIDVSRTNSGHMTAAQRAAVLAFLQNGVATITETARLAGCTPQNIYSLVKKQKLEPAELRSKHLERLWTSTLKSYEVKFPESGTSK